ncbi:hypothetical protein MSAN_01610700 [Mycena sanguinolenta]|uniref:Uncharacterized protein n=1 Tax=Mycena sanguinolenta TaxID=230812 RepID=A0A8H6Y1X7_9AGAR|nr:hypothetical protein MSAN_01610700 [Mycena sanguinolenta]
MGSYTSVLNDTSSTLYIKYAPNHVALDVAAAVAGAIGVIASLASGGAFAVLIDVAVISTELGVGGAALSAAGFLLAAIDLASGNDGYHLVAPGGTYRSEKLTLSLVHQADVHLALIVDDNTMNLYSGSFTVFTGATAGSTKRYTISSQLSKLDKEVTTVTTTDSSSADLELFANVTRVRVQTDLLAPKLAFQQNCSISDLD